MELFSKIVFGYKPSTFFVKSSNIDVRVVPKDASNKDFSCFVSEDFHPEKMHLYIRMLEFTFPGEDAIDEGVVIKMGKWNI